MAAPSTIRLLAAVVAFLAVAIYVASANQCYFCNGVAWGPEDDPTCYDPYTAPKKHRKDCGGDSDGGCLKYSVKKVNGAQHVARLCATTSLAVHYKLNACTQTTVDGRQYTVCHCTGDYCNSSPSALRLSSHGMLLALAACAASLSLTRLRILS